MRFGHPYGVLGIMKFANSILRLWTKDDYSLGHIWPDTVGQGICRRMKCVTLGLNHSSGQAMAI